MQKQNSLYGKLYFKNRDIISEYYVGTNLPSYLLSQLPTSKTANILDIGCGLGQTIEAITKLGYQNVFGIDLLDEAVENCRKLGLQATKVTDFTEYVKKETKRFDFILMMHVIEHLSKEDVLLYLSGIHELLNPGGTVYITTPNAQSDVGCYWFFEDFTHLTLFTSGSMKFVLKSTGFTNIRFLDPLCLENSKPLIRLIKLVFGKFYVAKKYFWNKIMYTPYHHTSPVIFSWELKVVAQK